MSRPFYGLFFDGNGSSVEPELVSRHWTFNGAMRAYKRRNPHIFRKNYANGAYENAGTFDKILYVDENGNFDRRRDLVR